MSRLLHNVLCRFPTLYRGLLATKGEQFNAEKSVYLRLIGQGDVVVELGANKGDFTELFGRLVGRRGRVLACEPVSSTRAILERTIRAAQLDQVTILPWAASNAAGSSTIYVPGDTHGQASLKRQEGGGWRDGAMREEIVKCVRLDEESVFLELSRLDFIKIDVEGAELPAIQGMKDILSKFLPVIHIEICRDWMKGFDYVPEDVENELRKLGYTNFFTYHRKLSKLESFAPLAESTNVICVGEKLPDSMKWV